MPLLINWSGGCRIGLSRPQLNRLVQEIVDDHAREEVVIVIDMLCAGPVDDLEKLIADCQFPQDALFLVEMLPQRVIAGSKERLDLLRFAYFDTKIRFASYASGRIFHRDF